MSSFNINDYGDRIAASANQYLKQNLAAITELIDQAYYEGSDDKANEFAKYMMTELFLDTIKSWIKMKQGVNNNTRSHQYEAGFTKATIKQLQHLADTATEYNLVTDGALDEATEYFRKHCGDTEPANLMNKIKAILELKAMFGV